MSIIWGIITARKDSVKLKNKNFRKFINKPLIEWSFVATETNKFDKVILTTDCEICIDIAKNYKHIEVPFKRPESLSTSETSHMDVIEHCLMFYKNLNYQLPDYVAIIQPTTPQRTKEDIEYLIDYVNLHPGLNGLSTFTLTENVIQKTYYYDNGIKKLNFPKIERRQDGNKLIHENGLMFIFKSELLLDKKLSEDYIGSLPFDNIEPLIYPNNREIIDIDSIENFEMAEMKMISEFNKVQKRSLKIGNRIIDEKSKPFVIAEIGINHEGDMKKAVKMIYDAYYAGCECVKFQYHIPEKEMTKEAKNVIPVNIDISIYDFIENTNITEKQTLTLKKIVEDLGMIYLCTPFSIEAADKLEEMNVCAYKIGSGEMNNLQLVEHIAKFKKPIFISTGMNPLRKIRKTVQLLEKYNASYSLFHCVSMYPTPYDKVNLPGIDDLKNEFPNILVGLSDHSIGITSCYGAYMKGCQIIEKHYTSSKDWSGADIEVSIDTTELKRLIYDLNILRDCNRGEGRLEIQKEEQVTIDFAYCSLTTTRDLKKGHVIQQEDLVAKRPNIGDFLAEDIEFIVGRKLNTDLSSDEKLFKFHLDNK